MRLSLLLSVLLVTACDGAKVDDTGVDDTAQDSDIDGDTDTGLEVVDADADGYSDAEDCDESNPAVHPGAEEVCDGVDQDCDGTPDDGLDAVWYTDADADGYGDPGVPTTACAQPANTVADATDCDDASAAYYPGAPEEDCDDPADYNCDGSSGYADADGDGWAACSECDDGSAVVNPSAVETCNVIDDDCDGAVDEDVESVFYADADGDGFGDPGTTALACEPSAGWVADATDCDGADAATYPGAPEVCDGVDDDCDGAVDEDVLGTFYADTDGDSYGDAATAALACEASEGWVADATDCDDEDAAYNPGAAEDCADPADYNCDGTVSYADGDADGFAACEECNDADAAIRPDATEVCDDADNDCDGTVDEDDAADALTWYLDADADGHGTSSYSQVSCVAPADYVASSDDCNDLDASTSPSAPETCDGEDDDCDGAIDEDDAMDLGTWYADADADGFGDAGVVVAACARPVGFVSNATDCDDEAAAVYPGADETCDTVDNDCDGTVDEDSAVDAPIWYADADADGFGNPGTSTYACEEPVGYVTDGTDCDDVDPGAFPGQTETCNADDDDCDGEVDEDDAADAVASYTDADGDGYGDPASGTTSCSVPSGRVTDATDCDDTERTVNPAATEACDSADVDEDCDGRVDYADDSVTGTILQYADIDRDGYGDPTASRYACDLLSGHTLDSDDCDDGAALVNPGMVEVCDDLDTDEDCSGAADDDDTDVTGTTTIYTDLDGDDFGDPEDAVEACEVWDGYSADGTDCDDAEPATYPGADELCDGVDNDCDGVLDDGFEDTTYYPDEDDDGFGDELGTTVSACMAPIGYRLDGSDCDDTDITVHPYAWEDTSNDIDDDCDGAVDSDDTTTILAGPATDDTGLAVTLTSFAFPYCGTDRTTLYVQSNGRITFGSSDTDYTESVSDFYNDTAIAGMWDDLNPASSYGGDIYYIQYPDALGVYWRDVREFVASTTNTFSMVLFDDGRVLFQYAAIAATDGLVGYTCGPGSLSNDEADVTAAMDELDLGDWGLGTGVERMYYEIFTSSDNDLDHRVIRLCPYVDGIIDLCAE